MGTFLLTHVSFTNNINNININDHYTTTGSTMMATAMARAATTGAQDASASQAPGIFLFLH